MSVAAHPIARAWERHGLALTVADIRTAEERLRGGDAVFVRRAGGTAEIRLVRLGDRAAVTPVIYDPTTGRIVTVLDAAHLTTRGRRERRRERRQRAC
ncbi:MAG TPA: hypothetical protein VE993_13090 [Stellaceae bacterium]|nr:hypothetical protein [Stellaceae bacterium]